MSNTIIDIKRHIQKSKKHEGMKMYSCQKCGFGSDCDRMFKEHLRARHFGYEVHDTVVDYFIDEMFSNKNNKRPGTDDELAQAQLAQLKHQMQNPQFHQPPRHMTSNSRSSSHQTSSKKLATSLNNVISEGRKSNRVQSPSLATMIQEIDSSQALSPMETFQLITNYRQQNNATSQPQQANQIPPQQSAVLMYLPVTNSDHLQTQQQQHHSQQQQQQQPQQSQQQQFHHPQVQHNIVQQQPSNQLASESLRQIMDQTRQQQTQQSQETVTQFISANDLSTSIQQYVTYANY